jgi:IclR family KDG regulon transcriptional repressor
VKESYHSSTIQRAIDVLNLFKENTKMTFTEMQEKLGFNKSTLFRVLYTLEYNKYICRDKHGMYELGLNIFILGNQASQASKLRKVTAPYLQELCHETSFAIHIGIIDGLDIIIVSKYNPPSTINMVSRIGGSVPAHCTGQGKTLLAYSSGSLVERIVNHHGLKRYTANTITTLDGLFSELEQIRERGYTIDNSEHEEHIRCVAVPILNQNNEIEAAISMTGLSVYLPDQEAIEKYAKMLLGVRDEIVKELGYNKRS